MISTRLVALLALAASLPLSESKPLDAFITYPSAESIWLGGSYETVIWVIDHHSPTPAVLTKLKGDIYLAKDSRTLFQYHLATNFNLTAQQVEVTVPEHVSGTYQVVLIGDSQTLSVSSDFTIID